MRFFLQKSKKSVTEILRRIFPSCIVRSIQGWVHPHLCILRPQQILRILSEDPHFPMRPKSASSNSNWGSSKWCEDPHWGFPKIKIYPQGMVGPQWGCTWILMNPQGLKNIFWGSSISIWGSSNPQTFPVRISSFHIFQYYLSLS